MNIYTKLSSFIINKYKVLFLISIAIFVLALLIAGNIGMDSKMEGMLPNNSESLKANSDYEKYFDSQDNVLVVVQGKASQCEAYLESLADRLYSEGLANNVLYKIDAADLESSLHLYLDTKSYLKLEKGLNDESSSLSNFLNRKDLIALTPLFVERLDEFEGEKQQLLFDQFAKLFQQDKELTMAEQKELFSALLFGNITKPEEISDYIVSDTGSTYLMIIKPNISMDNFVEGRANFFNGLQNSIDIEKSEGGFEVKVGITGGAFVQDNEADNTMFNGFFSTAILTFVLIILFIVLSFRRIVLPMAAGYPLLLGAILTTAFAYLMYKNLNMFSISFAVLLLGLGIDFAVHIISRYLEERANGNDVGKSISNTINELGAGLLVGATTSSVAFLTFIAAQFKAFTQMGVISGIGILLLCITMLILIPVIIMLIDSRKKTNANLKSSEYKFLQPVGKIIEKRPFVITGVILLLAISLSGNVFKAQIRTDMSELYPQEMECLKWLKIVEKEFGYNPTTLLFMVDNLNELELAADQLMQREDVKEVKSILEYFPENQAYKLGVIKLFNNKLKQEPENDKQITVHDVVSTVDAIKSSADKNLLDKASEGYKAITELAAGLKGENSSIILKAMVENNSSDTLDMSKLQLPDQMLTLDKLPSSLTASFVGKEGKLSVEVVPNVNIWDSQSFIELKKAIKNASGNTPVGMPAIMNEVTEYVKSDILRISFICLASLFIILFIMFRSIKDTIIAITPLAFTIYLTLGAMPLLGAKLNIFSIIAFPILIGIGIDSGVHLLHRLKTSPDKDIPYILSHTGKAIMMTTMTTLIGFGSLYFTKHPGLSGFGLTTVIGMSLCLVTTLLLLPSLYLLLYSKK